jgi:hypothetical protein
MKIKFCFLSIVWMLASLYAFAASPTDSLRMPRWRLDLGMGLKGMQYTGPLWNYYHGIEKQNRSGSQYARIPMPSPSIDLRLRLNLARNWFLTQGLSVGAWIPYTKCWQGPAPVIGDMWGDELEIMWMVAAPFGGGFQTGKNHFSVLLTPHLFLGGIQRVRSTVFADMNGELLWVDATISTEDTDYWGITMDPFAEMAVKYGMNRLIGSASLRYDRDIQLFRKAAMVWGSLEMGLTTVYREFDVRNSIYNFSEPGMSSGFRALNFGCMFTLF